MIVLFSWAVAFFLFRYCSGWNWNWFSVITSYLPFVSCFSLWEYLFPVCLLLLDNFHLKPSSLGWKKICHFQIYVFFIVLDSLSHYLFPFVSAVLFLSFPFLWAPPRPFGFWISAFGLSAYSADVWTDQASTLDRLHCQASGFMTYIEIGGFPCCRCQHFKWKYAFCVAIPGLAHLSDTNHEYTDLRFTFTHAPFQKHTMYRLAAEARRLLWCKSGPLASVSRYCQNSLQLLTEHQKCPSMDAWCYFFIKFEKNVLLCYS